MCFCRLGVLAFRLGRGETTFCEREWEAEGQARSGLALHVIRFRAASSLDNSPRLYYNMKAVTSFQLAIDVYLVGCCAQLCRWQKFCLRHNVKSHAKSRAETHAERSAMLPCPDYTNNQFRIAGSLLRIIWRLQHLLRHGFGMNIIQLLLPNIRRGDNVSSFES